MPKASQADLAAALLALMASRISFSNLSTLGSSFFFSIVETAIFTFLQSIQPEQRNELGVWLHTHNPPARHVYIHRFKDHSQHIPLIAQRRIGPLLSQAFQRFAGPLNIGFLWHAQSVELGTQLRLAVMVLAFLKHTLLRKA